ncbi:MAG: 16S rRNA (cytidine(1402)-2'-O)-methyltransferase [Comamonadaceae bacterium]|nr:MAG: 16S rRNA (cytidine(1402)-2'-O)-methyltransferase [Comamonadaceae bacterium]
MNAAREAASAQHYPQGALYVAATPIGNLADITLRALHVLQLVDAIACEDTRHTQSLLRAYGMDRPGSQLLAVHQHNEAQAAQDIVARLAQGQRIAYVSDAGTPGVSDPGARLVAAVQAAGQRCIPLPGASSVTTALSIAGAVSTHTDSNGFLFAGFLPTKAMERGAVVQRLAREARCIVLLEAPHRMKDLADALSVLGPRPVTLARELTKQFEEVVTQPAQALANWFAGQEQRVRGEFVVLVHPLQEEPADDGDATRVLQLLLEELPVKTAVRLAADITGGSRNALYQQALQLKRSGDTES